MAFAGLIFIGLLFGVILGGSVASWPLSSCARADP